MCGRYYLKENSVEIKKILYQLKEEERRKVKRGEVYPSNQAAILMLQDREILPKVATWGFLMAYKKGLLINARAETAASKKTFQTALEKGRCVIPANGFYEWDSNKNKIYFYQKGSDMLYMAGLYQEENRFVILTTEANASVKPIHPRMPLILTQEEVDIWLKEEQKTGEILKKSPPFLEKTQEYDQEKLELF